MTGDSPGVSEGTLLDGRVSYAQSHDGFRTGIEPVLLAAAIPARQGQRVLEIGTGAGAALLCLGMRVAGLTGVGIERDPVSAALARHNVAANKMAFEIIEADVSAAPGLGTFNHAFANPPWHDPASTRAGDRRRDGAKRRDPATLGDWISAMAATIAPAGTITLVVAAALAGELTALLHGVSFARITFAPLWPRLGQPAKIVLIQAMLQSGPSRISAGLVLHAEGRGYTADAEAILRGGQRFKL